VATLPGSRIHDEILPASGATSVGVSRPTNNAGGLEGGITNGEDLRVTAYMKPIATLMKPLRSVDLATMAISPATIERSDVCAVPAAAVVGEAMVAIVLADALLEKPRGDSLRSCWRTGAPARSAAFSTHDLTADQSLPLMIRPILKYGDQVLHEAARPVEAITREVDRLVEDMIETMYAAPGIGLAAPQIGVAARIFVIDLSIGRNRADLIVMINPEFVERDGMQLEEGCLSVPGFNARSCGLSGP
jgi:hypothetical protein